MPLVHPEAHRNVVLIDCVSSHWGDCLFPFPATPACKENPFVCWMNNKSLFPSSLFFLPLKNSWGWSSLLASTPPFLGCLYDWMIELQAKLVSSLALGKTGILDSSRWRNHMGLGSSLSQWRQDGVLFPNKGSPRAWLRNQPGVQLVAWTYCWVKLGRGGGRWQVTPVLVCRKLGSVEEQQHRLNRCSPTRSCKQPAKFPSCTPSLSGVN